MRQQWEQSGEAGANANTAMADTYLDPWFPPNEMGRMLCPTTPTWPMAREEYVAQRDLEVSGELELKQ
jgi:hypothetical protein